MSETSLSKIISLIDDILPIKKKNQLLIEQLIANIRTEQSQLYKNDIATFKIINPAILEAIKLIGTNRYKAASDLLKMHENKNAIKPHEFNEELIKVEAEIIKIERELRAFLGTRNKYKNEIDTARLKIENLKSQRDELLKKES